MKNKKWLILLIVAFPSLLWLILESSTINSRKLPHYGPKVINGPKDTSFYKVPDYFYLPGAGAPEQLQKDSFPLYAIVFISEKYRPDAFRLTGLWEYINYKKEKIKHIPFVLVTPETNNTSVIYNELKKLDTHQNIHFYQWPQTSFDSIVNVYFKEKPYYIDYSFFMLVDADRTIRGYYDARYVSEMKRLIEEHQHLRIKEEKQQMTKQNEIKSIN